MDQCYLVTHVVFTLSEWGALRLDKELLPHEYYFLREHMVSQIRVKNVHLVGEFVEALRIFGCDDDDDIVKQGINFLLKEQSKSDGSWDREEETMRTLYIMPPWSVFKDFFLPLVRVSDPVTVLWRSFWSHGKSWKIVRRSILPSTVRSRIVFGQFDVR